MSDTKKIVCWLTAFVLILCGAAVFVYGQVQTETENYAIEITKKLQEQQTLSFSAKAGAGEQVQVQSADQNPEEDEPIRSVLHVPDTYQVDKTNDEGTVYLLGNADISVPDVSHIPTWSISEKQSSKGFLEKIIHSLFPEGEIISGDDAYSGTVKMSEDTEYSYWTQDETVPMYIWINRVLNQDAYQIKIGQNQYITWVSASNQDHLDKMTAECRESMCPAYSEEEQLSYAGITLEEAKNTADDCMKKLELGTFVCQDWEFQLEYGYDDVYGGSDIRSEQILQGGYLLHYAREVEEVPLTYTWEVGGNYEESAQTEDFGEANAQTDGFAEENALRPWGYERVDILVTKDGIYNVNAYNLYDMGEVLDENPALLDFAQIQDIFEKNLFEGRPDEEMQANCHIEEVRLGYTRIYDPAHPETGRLVPAWDFIGWIETTFPSADPPAGFVIDYNAYSLLTVNAIDGTVINRELGY